jgi:hypothetical protein
MTEKQITRALYNKCKKYTKKNKPKRKGLPMESEQGVKNEKEYILESGQHFHTLSGRVVVLKRVGGTITMEEIKTHRVHTLVTGYPGYLQMRATFIHKIAGNALGEPILAKVAE